jgi:hypothetical protein
MKNTTKSITISVLLILAIFLVKPPILDLLMGQKFVFSINNLLSILCVVAAVVVFFVKKTK